MTFTRCEPIVSSEASLQDSHGISQAISSFLSKSSERLTVTVKWHSFLYKSTVYSCASPSLEDLTTAISSAPDLQLSASTVYNLPYTSACHLFLINTDLSERTQSLLFVYASLLLTTYYSPSLYNIKTSGHYGNFAHVNQSEVTSPGTQVIQSMKTPPKRSHQDHQKAGKDDTHPRSQDQKKTRAEPRPLGD